jgi:pyruvate/2-oxoglutarate/acetoin dehydrogenase E1 component
MSMTRINFRSAIRFALREELRNDERVFLIGEDIGEAGGVFKVTEGLWSEFGSRRVIDTPISESAIVGAALGATLMGLVPVAELMFCDFTPAAMDQIVNEVAKKSYLSGGHEKVGMVIRTASGAGISFGPQHSQSLEAWFMHTPGLYSVMPSNPRDAKGLLKSAIRSGKPVLFFEPKVLYPMEGEVPDDEELIPLGKAEQKTEGSDLTIVSAGAAVNTSLECASKLKKDDGINAEVIDLRSFYPLDSRLVFDSVEKTGRLLIVEDDVGFGGWGAEVAAEVAEEKIYSLDSPIKRVGSQYSPVPFSPPLEKSFLPSLDRVYESAKSLVA